MEKLNELLREYAQSIRRDDGTAFVHADAIRRLFQDRAVASPAAEAVAWAVYNGWSRICFYMTEEDARDHAQKAQKNHDLSGSLAAFRVVPLYAAPQPAQADTIQCQAHSGPDCTECGGTGIWPAQADARAPWPMLAPLHLEAIVFAYNEGYSKAYDGRSFPNPFAESGSQAAAWVLGTRDGNEARVKSEQPPAQADALAEAREPHSDDVAVDSFATEMKHKLALARAKGRGGWETCSPADLSRMLREHVEKGDPRDVANFCMMLWHHGSPIVSAPADSGEARLTDEQREAIEYAITWMDQNVSNRYAYTAAKELRVLLNGADR
ncbi:hypothetical protein [Burkholderia multivorans]|uniref:hypothetical protein n=1 Tax=Burkholderia multivorans TaxID=87883 RepID=UPI000D016F69|nr:hypothetical protein [Burkholderia multivorans]PRH46392.1 hypothetical protein C6V05_20920 [Burkholderia multivorans]